MNPKRQYRYNNSELTDGQRVIEAIKAAQGKRLTYAGQLGYERT